MTGTGFSLTMGDVLREGAGDRDACRAGDVRFVWRVAR